MQIEVGANQTAFLNTTGVESISNCQPADTQEIIDNDAESSDNDGDLIAGSANLTISGSWSGCSVTFQVMYSRANDCLSVKRPTKLTEMSQVPDKEQDQYGVRALTDCQAFPEAVQYQPVIFWFYAFQQRKPSLTFCQPSLQLWNVVAGVDMQTGLVSNVTLVDQNVPESNVTGLPAFNGYVRKTHLEPNHLWVTDGSWRILGSHLI